MPARIAMKFAGLLERLDGLLILASLQCPLTLLELLLKRGIGLPRLGCRTRWQANRQHKDAESNPQLPHDRSSVLRRDLSRFLTPGLSARICIRLQEFNQFPVELLRALLIRQVSNPRKNYHLRMREVLRQWCRR